MNYSVAWTPNAEQQLAAVWMSCADRRAVSAAATEIDALLSNNPEAVGWPRYESVRALLVPPLAADYEIVEDERAVYVLAVWDVTRNGSM